MMLAMDSLSAEKSYQMISIYIEKTHTLFLWLFMLMLCHVHESKKRLSYV